MTPRVPEFCASSLPGAHGVASISCGLNLESSGHGALVEFETERRHGAPVRPFKQNCSCAYAPRVRKVQVLCQSNKCNYCMFALNATGLRQIHVQIQLYSSKFR